MSESPSNWDRWGPDDERGTLNLVTPEKTAAAAAMVRAGRVYSLAIPLRAEAPIWPTRHRNWHVATHRNVAGPGPGGAEDILMMHTHGTTHIDAVCHVFRDGLMYNGFPANEHITSRGASRGAISNVRAIATRGVLLDVAGHHGRSVLDADHEILPEEVEAVAAAQGVEIETGDVLLFRTGWINVFDEDEARFNAAQPGPGVAAARWAAERGVVAMGADNSAVESYPTSDGLPVHQFFIRDQGGYLLELLTLDALAADGIYAFFFVTAPLCIERGLGSPINPLAIV